MSLCAREPSARAGSAIENFSATPRPMDSALSLRTLPPYGNRQHRAVVVSRTNGERVGWAIDFPVPWTVGVERAGRRSNHRLSLEHVTERLVGQIDGRTAAR